MNTDLRSPGRATSDVPFSVEVFVQGARPNAVGVAVLTRTRPAPPERIGAHALQLDATGAGRVQFEVKLHNPGGAGDPSIAVLLAECDVEGSSDSDAEQVVVQ
jgi:hypothetical protein